MAKKEITLPNWSLFGAHSVIIEVHQIDYDDDDNPIYQAAIGFFLDDGNHTLEEAVELDVDQQKHITVFTSIITDNVEDAIIQTASQLSTLFDGINENAFIFEDGEISSEVSIISLMESVTDSNVH